MATVDMNSPLASPMPVFTDQAAFSQVSSRSGAEVGSEDDSNSREDKPLHRIRRVRQEQEMSLRSVARNLGTDIRQLRVQENEHCDIRLSELYKWQKALNVPVADLLEEPDSFLSRPVSERAQMVRIMKTAATILERADSPPVERLAKTLVDQLVQLMPELEDIGPWHEVGQRRSLNDYGKVMDRKISEEVFWGGNESPE